MLKKYISTSFKIVAMYTVGGGGVPKLIEPIPCYWKSMGFSSTIFCYCKWNPFLIISLGQNSKIKSYVHIFFRLLIHTGKFTSRRFVPVYTPSNNMKECIYFPLAYDSYSKWLPNILFSWWNIIYLIFSLLLTLDCFQIFILINKTVMNIFMPVFVCN